MVHFKLKIFFITILLSPLLFFAQRKVEDFFNNRIDFVLDNNHGRAFMGAVVKEFIIDDSLSVNNTYNKIGIQPFYRYSQSNFFDKNLLFLHWFLVPDVRNYLPEIQ